MLSFSGIIFVVLLTHLKINVVLTKLYIKVKHYFLFIALIFLAIIKKTLTNLIHLVPLESYIRVEYYNGKYFRKRKN